MASDQRAGAWSRRKIRRERWAWLRKDWRAFAELAAGVAITCGVIQLVRPAFVRPYLVGAVLASAAWMVHYVMTLVGGASRKMVGIFGEIWTSDELGGLRRQGWHVINHVMLANRDVDHVLLGPGGFYSIETKFRSEWEDVRRAAAGFAPRAYQDAHGVVANR